MFGGRDESAPALPERDRQIASRVGGFGFERQRLLKLVDGFVQLALRCERDAQVGVRLDPIRHQPDGRAKIRQEAAQRRPGGVDGVKNGDPPAPSLEIPSNMWSSDLCGADPLSQCSTA